MEFSIAVLPGDGIGPDVIEEAVRVLKAVSNRFGHQFDLKQGLIGGIAIDNTGSALPDETLDVIDNADAVLFGAVGGPKWDAPNAKVRPEEGILGLRQKLGLFANLRPVKVQPALANSSPVKREILDGVDMIVVRELTGGLYFAKPKKRWSTSRGLRGVDTLRYTEQEIDRIMRVGFELALGRSKKVTSVDKANVLETGRLWREVATTVSKDYPEVELEHVLVDNAAMQLIMRPSMFDVIVSENTFGDILTDEASVLSGSLGMLPSASIAGLPEKTSTNSVSTITMGLYEPIHGSAPDIAGQGIANPIGTILSVAMLLRHSLRLEHEAEAIENAVEGVLAEGYRTKDISADGGDVVDTTRMGSVVAGRI